MSLPDISGLSFGELNELIEQAKSMISQKKREQKASLLASFKEQAAAEGLSLDDVLGKASASGRGGIVKPKYRNPEDPTQTWTGRGRKPLWVLAALDAGKSMDDLAI